MILTQHGINSLEVTPPSPSNVVNIGGRDYPYIQIGNQLWLTENLKYTRAHFSYPNDDSMNFDLGLLYQYYYVYNEIIPILPNGWRIPTLNDGFTLYNSIGNIASDYLSTSVGGRDTYGFNANLPGFRNSSGVMDRFQDGFYFWYQDTKSPSTMYNFKLVKSDELVEYDNDSSGNPLNVYSTALCVRLVRDIS